MQWTIGPEKRSDVLKKFPETIQKIEKNLINCDLKVLRYDKQNLHIKINRLTYCCLQRRSERRFRTKLDSAPRRIKNLVKVSYLRKIFQMKRGCDANWLFVTWTLSSVIMVVHYTTKDCLSAKVLACRWASRRRVD